MKIVYQSFDPSVNPGLFPSATVKELKTAGDDIALRLCGVIDFEAFRPECAEAAEKYWRQQQLANLGLAGNDAQQKLDPLDVILTFATPSTFHGVAKHAIFAGVQRQRRSAPAEQGAQHL